MFNKGLISALCIFIIAPGLLLSVLASRQQQIQSPDVPLTPQAATLIINEYLADPAGSVVGDLAGDANGDGIRDSADDEFVEIVNNGAAPLDVGLFTISDATQVRFTIPAGKVIPPGEAAVVFGGGTPTGAFGNATVNGLVFTAGSGGLSLNNGGDTITVKDNLAATVTSVTFGSSEGGANQSITRSPDITGAFTTHSTAAGSGGTLFSPGARVNGAPFTTTDPVISSISPQGAIAGSGDVMMTVTGINYQAASVVRVNGTQVSSMFSSTTELAAQIPSSVTDTAGTYLITVQNPGPINSNAVPFTVLSQIGINEYLADPPDGLAGDANGDGTRDSADDEFVEIVNRTATPIDVGGFTVRDADAQRFTFPSGAIIPAGEAAVIFGGGNPQGDFGNVRANGLLFTATLSLNNTGDTIELRNSSAVTVESITFGSTEGGANQSINRNPDISGIGFATHSSIPGSGGRLFSPGTRVDGSPFTVGPRITSITPDSANQGAPAFDMAVLGSGFEGASTVFIDGQAVAADFTDPGHLVAHVPATVTATSGPHPVQVRNAGGNRSNVVTLTIITPADPVIASISPTGAIAGSGDVTMTVTGLNFENGSIVRVNGSPVSTGFTSAVELVAQIPSSVTAIAGTYLITVRNPSGTISNSVPFTVLGQIGINEYLADPPDGLAGDANGDGTRDSADDEFVEIVNRTATPIDVSGFTIRDADAQRFTFPPGATIPAGEAAVVFGGGSPQGDFGNVRANGLLFTATLSLNNGGDTIELRNASAVTVESITFGSTEGGANQSINRNPDVSGNSFATHSSIPGSGGRLFSPGTRVDGSPFTVGPRITSITPDSANQGAPSFDMAVSGSGFEGTSTLFIDGQAVGTDFTDPGHLVAHVPATVTATGGPHPVQVRNTGGNRSNVVTLTIITPASPVIASISPDGVIAGGGDVTMTVTGTHFESGSSVRVNGSPVSTGFSSAVELVAQIPTSVTSVAGIYPITVQNPGGLTSNAVPFTVLGQVGINEYLADPPDGLAGDANGDGVRDSSQDEFVEIVNRTGTSIDVSGFTVRDADAQRFTFPPGSIIPAGEAAVIFGGGNPQGDFGNVRANGLLFTASLSLNNGGDTIELRNSSAITVESVIFGSTEGGANQSINRNPDVLGIPFATHSSIPGSAGRLFSPGTRVDGSPFTSGPRITSIAPDSVNQGALPFDIAVTGSGFEGTSTVLIDGQAVATDFTDPSHLVAHVPATVTATSGPHPVQVRNAGGNRSNVATLTVIAPAPTLSSVTPKAVVVGSGAFTMFLTGLNFAPGAAALVDGAPIATTFISVVNLRATVPASFTAAAGTHTVVVRNSDGKQSSAASFDVIPPTTVITSISPSITIAGGASFTMVVRGTNFKNNAVVLFDGADLATTFRSSSELAAQVPGSLITKPGVHSISVRNPNEFPSNDAAFQVLPDPPLIASLDPGSVIEGSGEAMIAVIGQKFQPGAVVRLTEATQRGAALNTTFVSAERLQTKIPAVLTQTSGNILLTVENPDFGLSNSVALKVFIKDPLVINEYLADPADGLAGDANGDGTRSSSADEFIEILNRSGEPFDISGYKLSDADALRHVFAAGTIVPPFEAVVVFGGGTPTGAFGNATENHMVFKASTGGLSLNNGGDTISLQDAQGHVVQEIKFGAAQGGAGQSINRDPDGDGATFALHTIVAADGSLLFSPGTKAGGQTFTIKPSVSKITPATVHVGSAEFTLTVSGSKFLPGAVVLLGSTPLPTVFRSDTQLEAQVAASLVTEGGGVDVRVKNPRGELSGTVRLLIADDPPRVSRITPATTGTGAENLEVSVTGERFQRATIVQVQGKPVETRFVSSTSLVAILPSTLFTRVAELSISVLNGDGNPSNALTLTVENGPLITRLSRGKLKAGGGVFELTVGGVAFKSGVVLFANDIALSTTFISDSSLTARIPAEMTSQPGALMLQARHPDGGRSNKAKLKIR